MAVAPKVSVPKSVWNLVAIEEVQWAGLWSVARR
jgi:hypothetical protein